MNHYKTTAGTVIPVLNRALATFLLLGLISSSFATQPAHSDDLTGAVQMDYERHLGELFDYFHRNPELSMMETQTAKRLTKELQAA